MRMRYFCCQEDRRRTGRYVAGGTALAVTLLGLYHLFLRDASTIAGVCVPAIIMASYIIWVLYSARRDRRKVATRFASLSLCFRHPASAVRSGRIRGIREVDAEINLPLIVRNAINADVTYTNDSHFMHIRSILKITDYNLPLSAVDISPEFSFIFTFHLYASFIPPLMGSPLGGN